MTLPALTCRRLMLALGLGMTAAMAQARPAPPNDACASAIQVFEGVTQFTTVNATQDGQSYCEPPGVIPDVWFSYQTPCSAILTIDTCGSQFDTILAVYRGD